VERTRKFVKFTGTFTGKSTVVFTAARYSLRDFQRLPPKACRWPG
jgi:hypothetical protein